MKTLTMIEMEGCPYCANAHRAIDALRAEGGAYANVPLTFIDENREPERTQPYAGQYYYVPSSFPRLRGKWRAQRADGGAAATSARELQHEYVRIHSQNEIKLVKSFEMTHNK